MHRTLVIAVVLVSMGGRASATKQPSLGDIAGGTINVIAFNRTAGFVVLTDSAITWEISDGSGHLTQRIDPQPGQKLFQLDDRTVCTFAGFAFAPTPAVPDFLNNVSAIMGRYKGFLSESKNATVEDKMQILEAVFSHYLLGVANMRKAASDGDYRTELFIAGYDPDGSPKLGRLILRMEREASNRGGLLIPAVLEKEVLSLSQQAVFIHGQRVVADQILQQPVAYTSDPAIAAYEKSQQEGTLLSIDELKALAISLRRHTAQGNPTVGGPDQIAVLANGHIQRITQPTFDPILPTAFRFYIDQENEYEGVETPPSAPMSSGVDIGPGLFTLFFRDKFKQVQQRLDEGYFSESLFTHCQLLYNGGRLQFEHSNRVYDSELFLGPEVDRNAPDVMYLMYNFPWKHVGVQGEFTVTASH